MGTIASPEIPTPPVLRKERIFYENFMRLSAKSKEVHLFTHWNDFHKSTHKGAFLSVYISLFFNNVSQIGKTEGSVQGSVFKVPIKCAMLLSVVRLK